MSSLSRTSSPDILGPPGDPEYLLSSPMRQQQRSSPSHRPRYPSPPKFKFIQTPTASVKGKAKKRISLSPAKSAHSIRFDDVYLPAAASPAMNGSNSAVQRSPFSPEKGGLPDGNGTPWRLRVTLEATQDEDDQDQDQDDNEQGSPARKRLRPSTTTTTKIPLKGDDEQTPRRRRGRPRKSDASMLLDATPVAAGSPVPGSPGHTPGPAAVSSQKRKRGRPKKSALSSEVMQMNEQVNEQVNVPVEEQVVDEQINEQINELAEEGPPEPLVEPEPEPEPPVEERRWSPVNLGADADGDDSDDGDELPNGLELADPFGGQDQDQMEEEVDGNENVRERSSPRVTFEPGTFDTPNVDNVDQHYPDGHFDSTPSKMPSPSRDYLTAPPENTMNAGHTPGPSRLYPPPDSSPFPQVEQEQEQEEEEQEERSTERRTSNAIPNSSPSKGSHDGTHNRNDPTSEHRDFDSIIESEGFSMVSLDTLPSARQHALSAASNKSNNPKLLKGALKPFFEREHNGVLGRKQSPTGRQSSEPDTYPDSASTGTQHLQSTGKNDSRDRPSSRSRKSPAGDALSDRQSKEAGTSASNADRPSSRSRKSPAGDVLSDRPSSRGWSSTENAHSYRQNNKHDVHDSNAQLDTNSRESRSAKRSHSAEQNDNDLLDQSSSRRGNSPRDPVSSTNSHDRPSSSRKSTLPAAQVSPANHSRASVERSGSTPHQEGPDVRHSRASIMNHRSEATSRQEDGYYHSSPNSEMKRRMAEWQREREAISREIQQANSSQVIVIDSDYPDPPSPGSDSDDNAPWNEHGHEFDVGRTAGHEAAESPEQQLDELDEDEDDIRTTGQEAAEDPDPQLDELEEEDYGRSTGHEAAEYPEQLDELEDEDDGSEDIWQQEAQDYGVRSDPSAMNDGAQDDVPLGPESSPWKHAAAPMSEDEQMFSDSHWANEPDNVPDLGQSRVKQLREQEVDFSNVRYAENTPNRLRYYYGKSSPLSTARGASSARSRSIASPQKDQDHAGRRQSTYQSEYFVSSPNAGSEDDGPMIDPTTQHENSVHYPDLQANGDNPDSATPERRSAHDTPQATPATTQAPNTERRGSNWFQKIVSLTPGWLKAPRKSMEHWRSPVHEEASSEAEEEEEEQSDDELSPIEPENEDTPRLIQLPTEDNRDEDNRERESTSQSSSSSRREPSHSPVVETEKGETYERELPLSISGYFSDEHYAFLRRFYRLAKKHPERFPYYSAPGRPDMIGDWIWTSDGVHGVPVTERQFAIVDRFVQELAKADLLAGGTGQVGWTDADLHRRLISIIIGEKIREEATTVPLEQHSRGKHPAASRNGPGPIRPWR